MRVNDGGCWACFAANRFPTLHVEFVMNAIKRAVPVPQIKITMHRRARRSVFGHRPPLATGGQNVHHIIDHVSDVDRAFVAAAFGRRDQEFNGLPLLVGEVARIT